jgi:hypothetical protein
MWPLSPLSNGDCASTLASTETSSNTSYLVMHTEIFQWPANMDLERSLVRALKCVMHIRVTDAGHHNFADTCFLAPPMMGQVMKKTGNQDPLALAELINDMIAAFSNDCLASPVPLDYVANPVTTSDPLPKTLHRCLSLAQKSKCFEILETRF